MTLFPSCGWASLSHVKSAAKLDPKVANANTPSPLVWPRLKVETSGILSKNHNTPPQVVDSSKPPFHFIRDCPLTCCPSSTSFYPKFDHVLSLQWPVRLVAHPIPPTALHNLIRLVVACCELLWPPLPDLNLAATSSTHASQLQILHLIGDGSHTSSWLEPSVDCVWADRE